MTREIWSGNYDKALPVSLHLFELICGAAGCLLHVPLRPAQRHREFFEDLFGSGTGTPSQRRRSVTIETSLGETCRTRTSLRRFRRRELRKQSSVTCCSVFALKTPSTAWEETNRFSVLHRLTICRGWIDLPLNVRRHLRYVPEMIVAMLADQKRRVRVEPNEGGDTDLVCRRQGL